jgi:hypothetical protein
MAAEATRLAKERADAELELKRRYVRTHRQYPTYNGQTRSHMLLLAAQAAASAVSWLLTFGVCC